MVSAAASAVSFVDGDEDTGALGIKSFEFSGVLGHRAVKCARETLIIAALIVVKGAEFKSRCRRVQQFQEPGGVGKVKLSLDQRRLLAYGCR